MKTVHSIFFLLFTSIVVPGNSQSKEFFIKDVFMPGIKGKVRSFDEFIISYKDRTAILYPEHYTKVVSNNGIFWPVILMKGKAIGLWKRNIQKDKVILEAQFFKSVSKIVLASVEKKLAGRLNNPKEGFRSFIEIQQWLSAEFNISMGYHAVNKYVKRKYGARLKVSRKSHVLKSPADEAVFKKPVQRI